MDHPDSEQRLFTDRPPANLRERLLAHCRPQPAIPAVIVFFLGVLLPVLSQDPQTGAAPGDAADLWLNLLVTGGIVASCALAVAAGFCSVFPQAAWFALAVWCLSLPGAALFPAYVRGLLYLGMAVAAGMLVCQAWRVRTGRFVPTIREYAREES